MDNVEFIDHERVVKLPLSCIVLNLKCGNAHEQTRYLFPDKDIPTDLGVCLKCQGKLRPVNVSIDVSKLFELLKDKSILEISFKRGR